ncbi:flagellar basal body-associated FliL family protein [uncultured Gilliamella sp.]|jgi:Flagellar basal body-associated protein|uniref:flagellar basal body-associated FliL family protein n=1 Tax=uncultured Gilliamella sp. TaxID=1193505 RepID=UPI0025D406A5|nr:flagellar basal body-associated FliL family protein [uncultured Gilliamella sp.]
MPITIKNKKMSVYDIIQIVITLLALIAAVYFWYQSQSKSTTRAQRDSASLASSPVFFTLQPFTISLSVSEEGGEINQVLYVGIVLRVANEKQKSILTEYLPEVRSDILLLASKQNINELKTESGKIALQEQIKVALSRQYGARNNVVRIDEVLFTDFIIR